MNPAIISKGFSNTLNYKNLLAITLAEPCNRQGINIYSDYNVLVYTRTLFLIKYI